MTRLPLVTGAAGFAGGHLVDHLLLHGPAVHAWANPHGRRDRKADPRIRWREVDVLDPVAVRDALLDTRPMAIYHCAGIAHVGETWAEPARALRVNVMGTHHVMEALRAARLSDCPLLLTGSALVYKPSSEAIDEASPLGPNSPYGLTKLAQEMLAATADDLRGFIARPFNHAGPRQDQSFVTSSFARQIAEIEAGLRPPVLRVGNLDARRDLTDVRDTVRAYRLIVERGTPRRPYNVCRGTAYRIGDLLDALVTMSRVQLAVEPDVERMRPSDTPVVLGNSERLRDETGWTAEIPIDQTLRDLLDYWRWQVSRTA